MFLNNSFDNQYNVAWGAFYLFGHEIGVEYKADNMALLLEWGRLFKSVGWWAPWDGICFVSDRPRKVSFDDNRLLHNEFGKAVEYSDGWGVSAWHGVRVPDHWIADRANLDPNEVIKASNVEQRAAGAAIVGWAKMLDHLPHKVIDSHVDPQCGDLLEVTLPGLPEPELYLKFECPRNGLMMEAVNKRELAKVDLRHAHAWHANVPARLFSYAQQRS